MPEANFGDALLGIIYGFDGTRVFSFANVRIISILRMVDVAIDGKGLLWL